jgi:uncharacterized membrane protein
VAPTSAYHRFVQLVALVPLVIGVVVAVIGALGWRERLPRNRFGGVRTPATLRSAEAFALGNRVAGLPIMVAGLVGVVSGAVAFGLAGSAAILVVSVLGLLGTLLIATAGGMLGHRAAEAMPDPEPELPAGCKGCACGGCDLAKSVGANVARVSGE